MGSRERAERLSNDVEGDSYTKQIALFVFDRCGNCSKRVECLVTIALESGGTKDALNLVVKDFTDMDCGKCQEYTADQFSNMVAKELKKKCANCDKLSLCVQHLLGPTKYADKHNVVFMQLYKCLHCQKLPKCVAKYQNDLNLTKRKVLYTILMRRFISCDKEKKQEVL